MIATYQDRSAHLSHLSQWWASRGVPYLARRANALLRRYGLRPAKAEQRTIAGVRRLAHLGCHPTLPVPGRVVSRHPGFFLRLEELGVELAMHGYDHVDFRGLSRDEAISQFTRAAAAFQAAGLRFDGFRCPYLSCTNGVREVARDAGYAYSSNSAIEWNVIEGRQQRTAIFDQLSAFYQPSPAETTLSLPRMARGLVEIPASVPDDLQLCDGLEYDSRAVAATWARILRHTHRRGELFVLVFHPEAFDRCGAAIEDVVREAGTLVPAVWVATLRDIASWWTVKSGYSVRTTSARGRLEMTFQCDENATVLARGLDGTAHGDPFMDRYHVIDNRTLSVSLPVRPFIGIAPDVPLETSDLLRQNGYILEISEDKGDYGIYLDAATLRSLPNEVELIEHLERSNAPLVRFWRWPRRARSALAVTGDLDALSLMDYAQRLVTL
jgi:hypothetical protein